VDASSATGEESPEAPRQTRPGWWRRSLRAFPRRRRFRAGLPHGDVSVEIYDAAEITVPAHGYTILKVANMLRSEHLKRIAAG